MIWSQAVLIGLGPQVRRKSLNASTQLLKCARTQVRRPTSLYALTSFQHGHAGRKIPIALQVAPSYDVSNPNYDANYSSYEEKTIHLIMAVCLERAVTVVLYPYDKPQEKRKQATTLRAFDDDSKDAQQKTSPSCPLTKYSAVKGNYSQGHLL
jgi:hypothetical protein